METKNKAMKSVLHHSIFASLPNGHGGEKRTYQVHIDVEQRGYVLQDLKLSVKDKLTFRRLWLAMGLMLRVYGIRHWRSLKAFLKQIRNLAYCYDQVITFFCESEAQVFLWESVRPEWYFLPYLAHKYGKRVIACPHNTESLVPNQKDLLFHISKQKAFEREVCILRKCEQVYVISHEETWLLNLWGIKAECYVYAPVGKVQERMSALKRQREEIGEKSFYLLLGTAINTPTRVGMQHVIDLWNEHHISQPLHVGGYGTDSLSIPPEQKNIIFLGEMTDEQLVQEQVHAKALLIYQPPTTGALTRISEALVAGIPVIANYHAARSYHNMPDVSVYQTSTALLQIISNVGDV